MVIVMATAMRLAGNEEGKHKEGKGNGDSNEDGRQQRGQEQQGDGNGDKHCGKVDCNSNKVGNGDCNNGGGQATVTATVTKRAMAIGTMVVGNKEGNGDFGKSNGDCDKGGGQAN